MNNSERYSVYRNQYSENGRFVLRTLNSDSKTVGSTFSASHLNFQHVVEGNSYWYQNDDEKKLLYKINDSAVVWVFKERSFWATVDMEGASLVGIV